MSTFDANNAQNFQEIEKQFAVKAVEQAHTYWNLIESVPPEKIRLTRLDHEIWEHMTRDFPEFFDDPKKLEVLDEEFMKDVKGKERWRNFIQAYEKKIEEYNFGSLIRTDCKGEYSEHNSIFVTRTQFLSIEIARNRLGLNNVIYEQAQKEREKARAGRS